MNDVRKSRLSTLYVAVALLLVGLALFQALRKDWHHSMSWSPMFESESMSVALSDMVYGLDRGYVTYKQVFDHFADRLWKDGLTDPEQSKARVRDGGYLNQTIKDATRLGIPPNIAAWGDFGPMYTKTWRPVFVEDIGRVDYYKLAFKVFGFQVESSHYLYFVLLLSTTVLFCIAFYGNLAALIVLIAYLAGLNVILQSSFFPVNAPAISSYRSVSTLAIIPLVHLAFAAWAGTRLRFAFLVALVMQTLLLTFIIWARTSVQWGALGVALAALLAWWWATHSPRWQALMPFAFVAVGLLSLRGYTQYAAHPAYFTDELLPGHVVWHSAYIGLALHPEWPRDGLKGDGIPFAASTAYMTKTQPDFPFTQGKITNGFYFRIHDQIIKKLYLEFAAAYPRYMLELFAYYKPARYLAVYRTFLSGISGIGIAGGLAAISAVAAGLAALRLRTRYLAGQVLIPAGAIALASFAPSMWAYPAPHVMLDTIWAVTAFLGLVAATALSFLVRLFRPGMKACGASSDLASPRPS